LRQDRWEQDGQPRSKVLVIAGSVQLLRAPKGEGREDLRIQDHSKLRRITKILAIPGTKVTILRYRRSSIHSKTIFPSEIPIQE
jgi:hypothetical protein